MCWQHALDRVTAACAKKDNPAHLTLSLPGRDSARCIALKKQFVTEECWRFQLAVYKCQEESRFPMCFDERSAHIKCMQKQKAAIDEKLA